MVFALLLNVLREIQADTMSNTKREPLLSDADLGYVKDTHTPEQVRDTYEAARDKDAELIQQLVDALYGATDLEMQTKAQEEALSAAKAAGFKPTLAIQLFTYINWITNIRQ